MLQFKNYLADFRPPYPEDPEAARWIKDYAEPNGVVNRAEGKFVDDQLLMRQERARATQTHCNPRQRPYLMYPHPAPTTPPPGGNPPMIIKRRDPPPDPPRRKLKL